MVLPGKSYTAEEIARVVLNHWWLVVVPLVLGTVIGGLVYVRLPAQYESETLIMVIPQRIPDSYVKPTVTANVEDRLRSISEQILSRSRLERIIQDLDLYRDRRRAGLPMEDLVQRMRTDIEVKLEGRESSFRVTYRSADPKIAQQVTEQLAALYIQENLRDREKLAENTSRFLESQLEDAKRRLIEQEKKLESYRRRYAGQLPSQLAGNLQSLQSAQMQVQALGESMNRARERRLLVERQIVDAQTLPVDVAAQTTMADSAFGPLPMSAEQQLETARAQLEDFKLRYTSDHPDVLAAEQTVRELQAKALHEAQRPPQPTLVKSPSPAEIARQKRLRDLQAEMDVIDRQLATAGTEEGQLKATMADYRTKIDVLPTRESELVELTRDYSTLQQTYSSLLQKREDSKLAANLERREIGEQFKILDPASLPERPNNQKQRLAVLLGGPLSGLALGLLLVAFLEYRDSSFKNEQDVFCALSLPVLGLIPVMDPDSDGRVSRGRKRRRAMGFRWSVF
jgi:polysaccharide chain length determinant protein (PEP-CTERM system associated)